jgi:hypothetical protein
MEQTFHTPDSTGSQYVVQNSGGHPLGPVYPLPPGGQWPELNLAGADWPNMNVASGHSIQPMPDPGKPIPKMPALHGNPEMGGIDPASLIPHLNLAGVDGVPPASAIAHDKTGPLELIPPTFQAPVADTTTLNTANVADDLISFEPRSEYSPDPALPDLSGYTRPFGLDMHVGPMEFWKPDLPKGDLLHYDVPEGMSVMHHPRQADPLVPDLQHPILDQQVTMHERPAAMSTDAMNILQSSAYTPLDDVPYTYAFMDQHGMNTTRRRHFDLMMRGLDGGGMAEERS